LTKRPSCQENSRCLPAMLDWFTCVKRKSLGWFQHPFLNAEKVLEMPYHIYLLMLFIYFFEIMMLNSFIKTKSKQPRA